MSYLLCVLWFFTAVYNINLCIEHIPSKVNNTADDCPQATCNHSLVPIYRFAAASFNSRAAANVTLNNQPRVHIASQSTTYCT